MKRVAIANLGCKVNRCDAVEMGAGLDPRQVQVVAADEEADLYVVNSCTVTHASGAQSLKLARQISRRHPGRPIVFTGCHASLKQQLQLEIDAVVQVVSNEQKQDLPAVINRILQIDQTPPSHSYIRPQVVGLSRPVVKVQDGCDQQCAYCIIPQVRGPSRSQKLEQVIARIQQLVDSGYQEVVLTGIHLGAYGQDLDEKMDVAGLLCEVLEQTAITRVRLSSIEPMEVSQQLANMVVADARVCRYLHLPLQSGSERILRAMRRPYGADEVARQISHLRSLSENLCIGLDVLVGFPGEDEEAFAETEQLLQGLDIAYLHVFPFSPRPNTPAATLPGKIPERIVSQRCKTLRQLSEQKRQAFYQRQVATRVAMVVERSDDGWLKGTSDNYLDLRVEGETEVGCLVEVEVTSGTIPAKATLLADRLDPS